MLQLLFALALAGASVALFRAALGYRREPDLSRVFMVGSAGYAAGFVGFAYFALADVATDLSRLMGGSAPL